MSSRGQEVQTGEAGAGPLSRAEARTGGAGCAIAAMSFPFLLASIIILDTDKLTWGVVGLAVALALVAYLSFKGLVAVVRERQQG